MWKAMVLMGVIVGTGLLNFTGVPIADANSEDRVEGGLSTFQPETSTACYGGYFTCPDDGEIFDYATPSCKAFCGAFYTSYEAATACNSHCTAACTNSGWFVCP